MGALVGVGEVAVAVDPAVAARRRGVVADGTVDGGVARAVGAVGVGGRVDPDLEVVDERRDLRVAAVLVEQLRDEVQHEPVAGGLVAVNGRGVEHLGLVLLEVRVVADPHRPQPVGADLVGGRAEVDKPAQRRVGRLRSAPGSPRTGRRWDSTPSSGPGRSPSRPGTWSRASAPRPPARPPSGSRPWSAARAAPAWPSAVTTPSRTSSMLTRRDSSSSRARSSSTIRIATRPVGSDRDGGSQHRTEHHHTEHDASHGPSGCPASAHSASGQDSDCSRETLLQCFLRLGPASKDRWNAV